MYKILLLVCTIVPVICAIVVYAACEITTEHDDEVFDWEMRKEHTK